MGYVSVDALENFTFHDSIAIKGALEGDTVVLTVKQLNVHAGCRENPAAVDLEAGLAVLTVEGLQLRSYTLGAEWQVDSQGKKYLTAPLRVYPGSAGLAAFSAQIAHGFRFHDWAVEQQGGQTVHTIAGCGAEPYFEAAFTASRITVAWDTYRGKAWYELHWQETASIVVETGGEPHTETLCLYFSQEGEPRCTAVLHLLGRDIRGWGRTLAGALAELERRLPDTAALACCLTCRHGQLQENGDVVCQAAGQGQNQAASGQGAAHRKAFDHCGAYAGKASRSGSGGMTP